METWTVSGKKRGGDMFSVPEPTPLFGFESRLLLELLKLLLGVLAEVEGPF
jgi:hypothetical protein